MKNEPWRGDPRARIQHLERALQQKRSALHKLNQVYRNTASENAQLVEAFAEACAVIARSHERERHPLGLMGEPCPCCYCTTYRYEPPSAAT